MRAVRRSRDLAASRINHQCPHRYAKGGVSALHQKKKSTSERRVLETNAVNKPPSFLLCGCVDGPACSTHI